MTVSHLPSTSRRDSAVAGPWASLADAGRRRGVCWRWRRPTSPCGRAGTRSRTACCGRAGRRASSRRRLRPGAPRHKAGIRSGRPPAGHRWPPGRASGPGPRGPPRRTEGAASGLHVIAGRRSQQLLQIDAPAGAAGQSRALFRARGRRDLHAPGRVPCAAPPTRRPGHAAFLLALRRLLRCDRLLVQRPARSPRLGVLLGRRRRHAAPAAAVRALRPGVPRSAQRVRADAGRAACSSRRLYAPGRGAARRARHGAAAVRSGSDVAHAGVLHGSDRLELVYSRAPAFVGGLAVMLRALRGRALGHRAPPAAVDRLGHRCSGAVPFVVAYVLPFVARARPVAPRRAARAAARPSCRSPLPRPSCAIG